MKSNKTLTTGKRFKSISWPFFFAFISINLLSISLFAQTDFSGSWIFNESKSDLGEGPMMSATSMTINQQPNLISLDLVQPSFDGGDMKRSEKYTLDGKESVNEGMMNSTVKTIASWSDDKKELKFAKSILADMNGENMEMKSNEAWKLSDDGKTLTVKTSFSSPMGEMNATLVYDKK